MASILTHVHPTGIESLDPSLEDGFQRLFSSSIPFELRDQAVHEGPQTIGTLELLQVQLLTKEGSSFSHVRVEVTKEADLFFHYSFEVEDTEFYASKEGKEADFPDYPHKLIRAFNSCVERPESHLAVFVVPPGGSTARLDFVENGELDFIKLMSIQFSRTRGELLQRHVAFRYNVVKSKLALAESRLEVMTYKSGCRTLCWSLITGQYLFPFPCALVVQEVGILISTKSPSLLRELQNMPTGFESR